jgi:Kdo2-lipid IVA lauroyltransferase/acyltransferase
LKALRHICEYVGLRLALLLIDSLSPRAAGVMARSLGSMAFVLARKRRRIATANVLRAGIAVVPNEAKRLARRSFQHFAELVVESLKSDRIFTEDTWQEQVELEAPPETMKLLRDPSQGMIIVSGHLGNWEIAAQLISFIKPVVGITRDMNNPYVDQLMKRRKPRNRFRLTPKHDADSGRFLRALKEGEVLALLIDQHARQHAMRIPFFGTPAATHTSPAMLHLITKVPLCFGYCVRTGPMRFRFVAGPPIRRKPTGKRQEDVRALLEQLTEELESAVKAYPEQYLWAHRRWRESGGDNRSTEQSSTAQVEV